MTLRRAAACHTLRAMPGAASAEHVTVVLVDGASTHSTPAATVPSESEPRAPSHRTTLVVTEVMCHGVDACLTDY